MVLNCCLGLPKNRITIIYMICRLVAEQFKRHSENGNASLFGQQVALVSQYRKWQVLRKELEPHSSETDYSFIYSERREGNRLFQKHRL